MICPKCKSELLDNELRCRTCGVKVRSVCPTCGTINKINALTCSSCEHELLKKCPSCGAYNLPTYLNCRKCNTALVLNQDVCVERNNELVSHESQISEIDVNTSQDVDAYESQLVETSTSDISEINMSDENVENQTATLVSAEVVSGDNAIEEILKEEEFEPANLSEDVGADEVEDEVEDTQVIPFSSQEVSEQVLPNEKDQVEVKNLIVDSLINSQRIFCSLVGDEGRGKTYVTEFLVQDLMQKNLTVLHMEATPVTQLSPFGVFQDLFLMLTGMPNYFVQGQQKPDDFVKHLENVFELSNQDAISLFELLYPSRSSYFEEILHNRTKSKTLIKNIFSALKSKTKLVMIIDDFDLIDASSFDLLIELYIENYFDENFKLFVTAQTQKNIDGYINFAKIDATLCDKFYLGLMSSNNASMLIKNVLNGFSPFTKELEQSIIEVADGSVAYIGQLLLYMNENGMFNFDGQNLTSLVDEKSFIPPRDYSTVFKKRMDKIKSEQPVVYKALVFIAMLGIKFNGLMLQAAMNLNEQTYAELVQTLASLAIIKVYEGNWLKVSSSIVWRNLFDYVKQDELFAQCASEILAVINGLTVTNIAYKPLFAQNAKDIPAAFEHWSDVVRKSAYLGDVNLYVLAQKQCLKLLTDVEPDNKEVVDQNIKYRLGKLIHKTEPDLAYEYLASVLTLDLEKNDVVSFIDVSSNAILAANQLGNYNAVIQIVDNVVALLDSEQYKLEIALITTRKLKTMLYLGNFEELINLITNQINPQLEDALSQNYTVYDLPISRILETWLETNLILADALILQGNDKAYDVISIIEEAINTHCEELNEYSIKLMLTKAFLAVMKGEVTSCKKKLKEISASSEFDTLTSEALSKINLIKILSKFFNKEYTNMRKDLFDAVLFANNCEDYLGKNLLKSALGKLIELEGDYAKAIEIYNEQINYFAKEKIALGVLLTWYFVADIKLLLKEPDDALVLAMKALDVAKNSKINSYYFQVLYKRLIAEIYLIKEDYEASKTYIQKALLITKKYGLTYLTLQLMDFYAKYYIEMFEAGVDGGSSPLVNAKRLYEKAINLASKLGLLNIVEQYKTEYQSLLTFAQLKQVSLT